MNNFSRIRHIVYLLILIAGLAYFIWPRQMALPPIAHAGGAYNGHVYTNSLEALDTSYKRGFRFFEIDFLTTSDNKIICKRKWEAADMEGSKLPPSYKHILESAKQLDYTPCDEDSLVAWLEKHADARLITDTKEIDKIGLLKRLAAYKEIMPQIIPQIYQINQYEPMKALGYKDIILTLYANNDDPEKLAEFLKSSKIYALTIPVDDVTRGRAWKLDGDHVVYTHTVNSCFYFRWLQLWRVDGVYTDSLAPDTCSSFRQN